MMQQAYGGGMQLDPQIAPATGQGTGVVQLAPAVEHNVMAGMGAEQQMVGGEPKPQDAGPTQKKARGRKRKNEVQVENQQLTIS